jgi:hypothetical protein
MSFLVIDQPAADGRRQFFAEDCEPVRVELRQHFQRLREVLESRPLAAGNIQSIALGGSYGRGEGGLLQRADGSRALYNDLDYFAFCRRKNDAATEEVLREIEKRESHRLGVDVEFKRITESDLGIDPSSSMMFYDLISGYEVIWGVDLLRKFAGSIDPTRISREEAMRLLWNRASGLYFARCAIELGRDVNFVQRNHQKCALSLGDAILATRGQYTSSVDERLARFKNLATSDPWIEVLLPAYKEAIAFKVRPHLRVMSWEMMRAENDALVDRWKSVFLELEGARLRRHFESLTEYANQPGRIFPRIPRWKALGIAFRDSLFHGACLRPITDYPRGALIRALCHLLSHNSESCAALLKLIPGLRIYPDDPPVPQCR